MSQYTNPGMYYGKIILLYKV